MPTKPGKPEEYYGLQLDFDVVNKILGCTSIQIVPLPNKQDILITDESGLLKEPETSSSSTKIGIAQSISLILSMVDIATGEASDSELTCAHLPICVPRPPG